MHLILRTISMGIGQRSFFKKTLFIHSVSQSANNICRVPALCSTVFGRKHLPGRKFKNHVCPDNFLNNRGVGIEFGEWPQSGRKESEREVKEACEPGRLIKRAWGEPAQGEASKSSTTTLLVPTRTSAVG